MRVVVWLFEHCALAALEFRAGEVVFEEMPCQPCHGYFCEKFAQPECILRVPVARVTAAIDRVLSECLS